MRLQRIYSSKLYLTSSRKDRIHAAINSPYNQPLVQQLEEYLDDDAQVELKKAKSEIKPSDNSDSGDVVAPSEDSSFGDGGGAGGGGGAPSFSGDVFSDFGDDDLADVEPMPEDEMNSEPEEPVEENTAIMGKVMATSLIWTTLEDVIKECDIIQGTLNAREDTKGVSRLQVKDNELWIYYNDNVNLNDTMISVIETLNSTGYTYLAFSRLARSNNAIVFDINLNTNSNVDTKEVK